MRSCLATDTQLSGATQIPLLSAGQLYEGAILGGMTWQQAWEVASLSPPHVILRALSDPNRTSIITIADILPDTATANAPARTVIFEPIDTLEHADRFTVYVTLTAGRAEYLRWVPGFMRSGPVIPVLYPLWNLPEGLRRYVE